MSEQIREVSEPGVATVEQPGERGFGPLFGEEDTRSFRDRWDAIQRGFVDEPRQAVQQADALVAETMQRLTSSFADTRTELEKAWGRDGDISTEELRQSLRRYHAFFDRLLSV